MSEVIPDLDKHKWPPVNDRDTNERVKRLASHLLTLVPTNISNSKSGGGVGDKV